MAFNAAICEPWPLDLTCFDIPDGTPQATIDRWQRYATEYLWAMTGRRLGPGCPITVRPCRKQCLAGYMDLLRFPGGVANSTGGWVPYVGLDGEFRNATICGCERDCHCGPEVCEIELPGPVYDIVSVTVGTAVVPAAEYRVVDGRFLRRINSHAPGDPDECWPMCQDMGKLAGTEDTFAVTYRTGLVLPVMAQMAMSQLTAHFIRGCGGGCGCGVGTRQNLAKLSRQGVDLEFADPQQLFTDGRTGIEAVDFFIRAMNPYGLGSPMRVLSPDAPRRPQVWN